MTDKVHGFTHAGQHLVGDSVLGLPMFVVTTATDIVTQTADNSETDTGLYPVHTHNAALDALIQAISVRAQPVIVGTPAGTGPYTLHFAVEHLDIFGDITAQGNDTVANIKTALGDANATLAVFTF